jgi:glutamate racemase
MIGVFDSGYGGLTILHGLIKALPQYSYIYLGDNARAPYGQRPQAEIIEFTWHGVKYLLDQGAPLVILACNTASAVALRPIQQQFLPQYDPERRVLGIVVPTIEQITGIPWQGQVTPIDQKPLTIGLVATDQTVASGAYEHEIKKRNPAVTLVQQPASELVTLIERGASQEELKESVQRHIRALFDKAEKMEPPLSAVVLGCTHFEIIADLFQQSLPARVRLYEQPTIVADSLKKYLQKHTGLEQRLTCGSEKQFLTTGDESIVSQHSQQFFGRKISFANIRL